MQFNSKIIFRIYKRYKKQERVFYNFLLNFKHGIPIIISVIWSLTYQIYYLPTVCIIYNFKHAIHLLFDAKIIFMWFYECRSEWLAFQNCRHGPLLFLFNYHKKCKWNRLSSFIGETMTFRTNKLNKRYVHLYQYY